MKIRIEEFVVWANTHATRLHRSHDTIPPDPHGNIGTARFRRTLAWHIARRPEGLIALAIQYGHLRTLVSESYANQSRTGIHDLLDYETARTVADHLSDIHHDLTNGNGVSGPSARGLIQAAAQQQHQFGGIVTTPRQSRALLADPLLNVFENRDAYLTCNYDASRALCHPERQTKHTTPSLNRCQTGCANIARTDHDAARLHKEASRLSTEARSPLTPKPVADRLSLRASHLRAIAEQHEHHRITINDGEA